MEVLIKRHKSFVKALKTFEKSLAKFDSKRDTEDYEDFRDSLIKRFEYCSDLNWKVLKDYLLFVQKVEAKVASPRGVYKMCFATNFFSESEFQIALEILEDRNLTAHSYNEEVAEELSGHMQKYYSLMSGVCRRVGKELL